jgi:hypothetical protein
MQTAAIDDYIRHNSGVRGKVTGLSPDGTIADVYNLGTRKTERWALSLCSPDNDEGVKPKFSQVQAAQPVRVAMGPIVGAILIANLITGAIGFVVLLLSGVIH